MAGKTKSKYFRVALEGATTDGRTIAREWITQMAKNYNPATYGARVNLEHLRGLLPDGPFKAYGDVTALRAENVDGKLGLYAQIDPTDELVTLNSKRQKIYTSIEVDPNFAKTGEAYLVGLAITDNPASLGTEMLSFSAQSAINPLAARKQNPDTLFTAAVEVALEFEESSEEAGLHIFSKVSALLKNALAKNSTADAAQFADLGAAVTLLAENQSEQAQQVTALSALPAAVETVTKDQTTLRAEFDALVQKLNTTPHNHTPRPAATGGTGETVTDC
ncbi:GPO family capsid scaffolding protein [Silvimonas sp.]|uniref:GPO family capsid scaffolding protein n=1 Tax=Silvimonas sp. TaxID=2650811 RepID=UPI0028517D26|nr:GPO family capsid scaffolding protein [Silvimonas sp.]MDR3429671.1 GPO family capsid scaffolding protein [Silvimonas sp.]